MKIIHEFKVISNSFKKDDGTEVICFNYTALCTDGSLWSRIEQTDGFSTDWIKHPDIG